jgi:caffeoyl-CoA O-methyltransferase
VTPKTTTVTPDLLSYTVSHTSLPPDALQAELIAETRALGDPATMQISPDQGAFLTVLTRTLGVRKAVEVGTFTGYSSICIARGLAEGGRLVCCDISDEWTSVARRYWERAGLADRIELHVAPALDTLRAMPPDPVFDLAFIDADKTGYPAYWEELVPRVRSGGVLLVDNVFNHGRVVDPAADDATVTAIRAFNDMVAADDRVDVAMLTIADGLTFARRR